MQHSGEKMKIRSFLIGSAFGVTLLLSPCTALAQFLGRDRVTTFGTLRF